MTSALDPKFIFDLVGSQLPADLHDHVLIIGSLAAAYHYRDRLRVDRVNTKDADIAVQPAGAVEESRRIAERLRGEGWMPRGDCKPGGASDPDGELSVIRLHPADTEAYFLELLALPEPSQVELKRMTRVELSDGWYVLPSFRHLSLTTWQQKTAHNGIHYAAPETMALANLLAHRTIGAARVSQAIAGLTPLRSAKDLGRVLALARMATRSETEAWVDTWVGALREHFPDEAADLAKSAGTGLRELLEDRSALLEAHHTVDHGLLQGFGIDVDQLQAIGQQLILDALDPLARRFEGLG